MSSEIRLILKAPLRGEDGPLRLGRVLLDGVDRGELVYVGREPHVEGPDGLAPLPREAYGVALVEALDELAGGIWGDDWSSAVAEMAGMNRRSTARDRVRKHGLPPGVLSGLVRLSERDDAREVSGIARAVVRYWDTHADAPPERAMDGMMSVIDDFRGPGHFDRWLDGLMGIDRDEDETIP